MPSTDVKKNNKIILRVKRDKVNRWFYFGKGKWRLQLAGDTRKWGFWLLQYAEKVLGKAGTDKFMADFTNILHAMEQEDAECFALYEMPEIIRYNQGPNDEVQE